MNTEEYIINRLDNQIAWYDKKSMYCQKKYKRIKVIQIISTAIIPFLASFVLELKFLLSIISALGVLVTVLEGVLSLNKYHENWIEYRSICETLQREKYMFSGKAGVYSDEGAFVTLVERIETIISKENINWANLNHNDNGGKKNG